MPVDTLRISFDDRVAQNNSNARNAKIAIAAGIERFTAGCAKNCCTAGKEPETVVTAVPFSPSETEETLVLYRAEYGKRELWVRPVKNFCDWVDVGDLKVKRFELMTPD